MKDRTWDIAGALTGIVFVGLLVASMGIAGDPELESSDPPAKIARALVDQSDKVTRASMIMLVGVTSFLLRLPGLFSQSPRTDGGRR